MYLSRSLPRLTASHQDREEEPASHEEAEFRRTQSTHGLSGPSGRKKASEKLTAAHSGSSVLRTAEDEPVAVYYLPRAFEELLEMEGVA